MVQIIKDDIRKSIMEAGKMEFLEHGFERASIRNIAFRAGVSKSNIYNYFKNKDDLFVSILKPTMEKIQQAVDSKLTEYVNGHAQEYIESGQSEIVDAAMKFVFDNRDECILLMYRADGSSYANFTEYIKDIYTDILTSWLNAVEKGGEVSRLFLEAVASFYVNTIGEIIIKNKKPAEAMQYLKEFQPFMHGGWKAVLDLE